MEKKIKTSVKALFAGAVSFALTSFFNSTAFAAITSYDIDAIYSLGIENVGTGDSIRYFKWIEDSNGNLSLSEVDDASSADLSVNYDSETNVKVEGIPTDLSGTFVGLDPETNASSSNPTSGGAIFLYDNVVRYEAGTVLTVDADFVGNSALNGGAIFILNFDSEHSLNGGDYFDTTTEFIIKGDFLGNSATTGDGGAINISQGIVQLLEGDFVGNSAGYNGGAIYNAGTIKALSGDFTSNYAANSGGAISNNSTIGSISGDFTSNYAAGSNAYYGFWLYSGGGAIFNNSTIDSISGEFGSNSANGSGGAIYNSSIATINSITGSFTGNYVSYGYYVFGGAIFNAGTINSIVASFDNNYAIATNGCYALGGAVYNEGTISSLIGSFANNTVSTSYWSAGGAIYNAGTMSVVANFSDNSIEGLYAEGGSIYNDCGTMTIEGNFINNYAAGDSSGNGDALGGAIYDYKGTLTFKASDVGEVGSTYYYLGNFATTQVAKEDGSYSPIADDDANGGFLYMNSSTVDFDIDENSLIIIGDGTAGYDSIASENSYSTITKTGAGDLVVNSSMEYYTATLSVEAGNMYLNNYDLGSSSSYARSLSVSSGASFIMGDDIYAYVDTLSVSGIVSGNVYVSGTVSLDVSAGNAGATIVDGIIYGDYSSATVNVNDIGAAFSSLGLTLATTSTSGWALSGYTDDFTLSYEDSAYSLSLNEDSSNILVDEESGTLTYTLDSEANTIVSTTLDSETGTTSDVVLSTEGNYTLSTTLTVDETETNEATLTVGSDGNLSTGTVASSSTVEVSGGTFTAGTVETASTVNVSDGTSTISTIESDAALTVSGGTSTIGDIDTGSSVTVSGGSLYFDNSIASDSEDVASNLLLQNSNGSINISHEDDLDAAIITVEDGYVGILHSDGNIILTEESEGVESTYALYGETTLNAGDNGAVIILGDVAIAKSDDNEDETNTALNIAGNLSLAEGTSLNSTGVDLTVTADNATVSISNATINVGDGETALTVSGEGVTVEGTFTSTAGEDGTSTAITVSNSSGEITFEDGAVISSDGVALTNSHEGTDSNGLTAIVNGFVSFEGDLIANSPLYITAGTYATSDASVTVKGGTISASGGDEVSIEGLNLVLTTNDAGTLANFSDSGAISISDGNSIIISGSASMLVGKTYLVADASTVDSNQDNFDFTTDLVNEMGDFDVELVDDAAYATAISLSYFSDSLAETLNEENLANALDAIEAIIGDDAANEDMIAFKLEVEANGLSSYVMNNYSYIAEVDTMLLSNQNFANVNRARRILEKSAGIQLDDEDGSISIENDDGTISVVDASEVSLIKYSNVAQLQSINMLGSKDASNGVAGYDYWSVGSTANFDEILSENALVGVSIGGTYNKVEGDTGDNANSTAFLLNFYGVYAYEGLEVFANLGYAHFWNEGSKGSARADWDSDAFNGLIGVSYKMETTVEGLSISPVAMLNLVCLEADSASYSNGVNVDDQSYFSAKLMLGFEVEYALTAEFNVLARAMYAHEMGDTTYDNVYSLGSLSGVNYIGGEAGADSAVMGLGLSYDFSETCTAYFDYNAYAYSNLITHSLNLSVAFKF